jgi:hypothetical protein
MIGKKTSLFRLVTSIALVMFLCLSMTLPALAGPGDSYSSGSGSSDPAKAAITKVFKMPINTTTPAATFTFTFTAIGMDGGNDPSGMPPIAEQTISFLAGEEPVYVPGSPAAGTFIDEDEGVKSVVRESVNFLADLSDVDWAIKGAGIYTYKVVETSSNITIVDPDKEGSAKSDAEYLVEIWVEEDSTTGELYAKFIVGRIIEGFVDEYYDGEPGGVKVDPSPGGSYQKPGFDVEEGFSQLIFTNKYWKTDGGGEDDHKVTALEIIKKITGNGAVLDTYFDFDVTVTKPSVVVSATPLTYKAYVLDATGTNVTSDANYSPLGTDANGNYILFTSGTEIKGIKLTNNQRLAFVNLHVGSSVAVTEAANNDYTPKYQRTFAGESEYPGIAGFAWGFPINLDDPAPHYIKEGAGANIVTFTNTRTGATPTGISVNDIPYILIALVAISLAGFLIIGLRRNSKRNTYVRNK